MLPGEKVKQNEGSFGEKNAFVVKNIKRGKRRKGIYILLKNMLSVRLKVNVSAHIVTTYNTH